MTKYKALMSIVVVSVVAVATITWSPQIADARWATQEVDRLVPLDPLHVASLDAASTELLPADCDQVFAKMGIHWSDDEDSGPNPDHVTVCVDATCYYWEWVYFGPEVGWKKVRRAFDCELCGPVAHDD